MSNSEATARSWVQVLARRQELPFASELERHFEHARLTRLCDCGCHSFECQVQPSADLPHLFAAIGALRSFEVAFASSADEPVDVVFYADELGLLSGVDVHLGLSNHAPMPKGVVLGPVLYTVPSV